MRQLGQHPHILKFHGVAREGNHGSEHLVTELASEGSLHDVLSAAEIRGEKMTLPVLLMIAQQVCEAMQAISHADIVHRDLALRNVLVSEPLNLNDPESVNIKVKSCPYAIVMPMVCIEQCIDYGRNAVESFLKSSHSWRNHFREAILRKSQVARRSHIRWKTP